ncbi:MAG: D-2-hydroxyacid dehydrogenase [Candidatus Egerieousia sp.]
MKIVFLDAATLGEDISLQPLAELGDFTAYPFTDRCDIAERIKDCEVLIINKILVNQEVVDAAPNLKLICEAATGTNNIDIAYAESKGIPVKNVAGYSTESVAQVTMALILNLSCHLTYYDDFVKRESYSNGRLFSDMSRVWGELKGQRLGIIGLGTIGSKVASYAEMFGLEVVYYSTNGRAHSDKYEMLSLDELMRSCDFISVHAPLNDKTSNLITYEKLSLCKQSAKVINIGRGGIINEEDLVKALNDNLISGAGVDVFSKEPLPADSPFFKIEDMTKIILAPHIGWTSIEARKLLVKKVAENIKSL